MTFFSLHLSDATHHIQYCSVNACRDVTCNVSTGVSGLTIFLTEQYCHHIFLNTCSKLYINKSFDVYLLSKIKGNYSKSKDLNYYLMFLEAFFLDI
jgi:hypothetical protein